MSKKRIDWLDLIKIIACIMVVLLHSINIGLKENIYTSGLWIYYIGTFAIPLFFMVNGFLMIGKEKSNYKGYLVNKIQKVLIVVSAWNFPILCLKIIIHKDMKNIITELFGCFFQKGTFSHFWYLGALILLYIFLPMLNRIYLTPLYERCTVLFILLNIFLDIFFVFLYLKYDFIFKNHIIQTFRIWTWLLYYLLGGLIKKKNAKLKNISFEKLFMIVIILIGIVIKFEIQFGYKLYGNLYAESFYSNFLVIITSILIFILISKLNIKKPIISNMSKLIMGIYIVHMPILRIVVKITKFNNNYYCLINFVFVFVMSIIVSYIISKIPHLKELIKL